ncbi:unnamed protein product (macronuclear) [Paramecium tetraurelia]|uniref:Uncharacterized protein n=1 Tax=Paramecium tetraurelia TaxID=5888 RepID=A0E432_PARTE|nr:uncharacterized protein GSPATT00023222001 [Paramecium tetraurelia]CAK90049.1 unnamed protein product [Paramecium tetraurelia]|eukprot:XP_001457446.1 hypothetical protein (macronuclear) [Paramecium tetraurelia strain d4-2]
MGICMSNMKQRKDNQQKEGELGQMVKKLRTSPFPEEILKKRISIDTPYNAYRNPILNRRLRVSVTLASSS